MKSWSNSTRAGHAAIPDSRRPDIRIGRGHFLQCLVDRRNELHEFVNTVEDELAQRVWLRDEPHAVGFGYIVRFPHKRTLAQFNFPVAPRAQKVRRHL